MDTESPSEETFLFDVNTGQLLSQTGYHRAIVFSRWSSCELGRSSARLSFTAVLPLKLCRNKTLARMPRDVTQKKDQNWGVYSDDTWGRGPLKSRDQSISRGNARLDRQNRAMTCWEWIVKTSSGRLPYGMNDHRFRQL
jgi:hypothetical protein